MNRKDRTVKNKKATRRLYADLLYLNYTRQYFVVEPADYPEYIAQETGTGYLGKIIRKLMDRGLMAVGEEGQYLVTEQGIEFLNDHEDMLAFFESACPYVSVDDYVEEQEIMGADVDHPTIMLSLLKRKAAEARNRKEYSVLKDLCVDLSALSEADPDSSLYYMVCAVLIEMSGIEKVDCLEDYRSGRIRKKELLNQFKDYFYVSPIYTRVLSLWKELLSTELLDRAERMCALPFNLCTKENAMVVLQSIAVGELNRILCNEMFYEEFLNQSKIDPNLDSDIDYERELIEVNYGAVSDSDLDDDLNDED